MTNRAFRHLKFVQNFINDREIVPSRKNERFNVIKFLGEIRKIRANV